MFEWLKKLFRQVRQRLDAYRKWNTPQFQSVVSDGSDWVAPPLPPIEPPPPDEPPPITIELVPPVVEPPISEEERRRILREWYEKERRKKDKWVKPKGRKRKEPVAGIHPEDVEPAKVIAEKDRAKPVPEIDGSVVPEDFIIDEHHAGGKVLFEEEEMWGQFNFRDTILDQLERYYVYLRRMRRTDKDAYALYRHIGANVEPYLSGTWGGALDDKGVPYKFTEKEIARMAADELTPAFKKNRPSFGCVAYGTNPLSELRELKGLPGGKRKGQGMLMIPKFMYFTKYSRPPAKWQPMTGGDIYGLTVWWDRPHDPHHWPRKYGVPQDFGIWVSKDGRQVKVLKEHFGFDRKGLRGERWAYPHEMKDWAKGRGIDVQIYMSHLFIQAVKSCEDIDLSVIRVNVHKGDLTAVFGVNQHRLAYFFKDRDMTWNESGTRERIFHIVKPHQRKDGTYVKMHPRGLREFEWAGYRVQLTVPGLHHEPLSTFRYGSVDGSRMKKGEDYVSTDQIGQIFEDYIRTGDPGKDDE